MYKLFYSQKLPIDQEKAWDFFSSPDNLEKITPSSLAFTKIYHHANKNVYDGQILVYTISPFWKIELEWVTEIIAVQKPTYFVDEQKFGPYAFWHHEHWFSPIPGGVLVEDVIYYKMPFGLIGRLLNHIKIRKDLEMIFSYRHETLEKLFGSYSH